MKADGPGDFARHNVTPDDLKAIQQRHIESADARAAIATVERAAEAQARKENLFARPPKRPYAGMLPARLR